MNNVSLLENIDSLHDLLEVVQNKTELIVAVFKLLAEVFLTKLKNDEEGMLVS